MSNRSFSDLPGQQRRERIAAVIALGLARVLDQRSKISANSRDPSLELLSGLRLPVSEADFRPEARGFRPEGKHREMIGESTMNAATAYEIARLEIMTITKVVERFESLFGEKCRSRNKRYLIRRIAWRLQANAEGDLSELAMKRAAELVLNSTCNSSPLPTTIVLLAKLLM
jgi:hypothetical protein